MKDKEILEEVYRRVVNIAKNGDANVPSQVRFKEFRDFIEREWQREDEKDDHPLTKWDEGQQYFMDVSETERHRGLEIDEEGTVHKIK